MDTRKILVFVVCIQRTLVWQSLKCMGKNAWVSLRHSEMLRTYAVHHMHSSFSCSYNDDAVSYSNLKEVLDSYEEPADK